MADRMPATDDDRSAAAALHLKTVGEPHSLHDKAMSAEIEMGLHDDWDCVQAFAAHRHVVLSDPDQNMAGGMWYRRWFKAVTAATCPDCEGLGYLGGEDTPSICMNTFQKLALSESFERVAKVAKEREAFNEAMALREVLMSVTSALAAAISLLERGGKAAKKAASSDVMFDQMILDYKKSLEHARNILKGEML